MPFTVIITSTSHVKTRIGEVIVNSQKYRFKVDAELLVDRIKAKGDFTTRPAVYCLKLISSNKALGEVELEALYTSIYTPEINDLFTQELRVCKVQRERNRYYIMPKRQSEFLS